MKFDELSRSITKIVFSYIEISISFIVICFPIANSLIIKYRKTSIISQKVKKNIWKKKKLRKNNKLF